MAVLLIVGFICNFLIRPVAERFFMSREREQALAGAAAE